MSKRKISPWLKWLLCYDKVTVHYLHFGLDEILLFSMAKFDLWQCSKPQNSENFLPHSRSQSKDAHNKLFYIRDQLPIINHKWGRGKLSGECNNPKVFSIQNEVLEYIEHKPKELYEDRYMHSCSKRFQHFCLKQKEQVHRDLTSIWGTTHY